MAHSLAGDIESRAGLVRQTPVLRALAAALRADARRLVTHPPFIPDAKALLARDAGVCPHDGARLAFDPWSPYEHRCDRCGTRVDGDRHHRAWITRYQIWLSERAVHLALLGALDADRDLSAAAGSILAGYAARYHHYPNRDNVLGPTRLFFSTYLESIWLVQTCVAAALLRECGADTLAAPDWAAIQSMVGESAVMIAEFDEGWSNRQVWNNAAMLAAGAWLARGDLADHALRGPHGILPQLETVGPDGFWHEGENYHVFALRGFLLAAEWSRWAGEDLYRSTRLGEMYAAPLATLLPDLTLPARGDAPFGVSVRQRRFAELWEHGRARVHEPRLDQVLCRLYDGEGTAPDLDANEMAEQEQHRPPAQQFRERLGWKGLLWMRPQPPAASRLAWPATAVLTRQECTTIRTANARHITVEWGAGRRGHGHPDCLHLAVFWGDHLLGDMGTASYVAPSLHWYRSTLAHNAPLRTGGGQEGGVGWCAAIDHAGEWWWCRAQADELFGRDTRARRTVVVGPAFVLDLLDVRVPNTQSIDLPIHPFGAFDVPLRPVTVAPGLQVGPHGLATIDGAVERAERVTVTNGERIWWMALAAREGETVLAATAPGRPGADFSDGPAARFLIRRASGSGRWITCLGIEGAAATVRAQGDVIVVTHGGTTTTFHERREGIDVVDERGVTALRGGQQAPPPPPSSRPALPGSVWIPTVASEDDVGHPAHPRYDLGAACYRRSETPYGAEGRFDGEVWVAACDDALVFRVDVHKDPVIVRPLDAADPRLDNEVAEIHSDGVQCYVGLDRWEGYVVLPEMEAGTARVCPVRETAADTARVSARTTRTPTGYRVLVRCSVGRTLRSGDRVRFQVVINEMRPDRVRRAGQLALTGGGWVYLRGDRESEDAALVGEIV
ncbi:MAG TPA: heparinase II/III family protein [Gemmatimonadales bacterium]